MPISMESSNRSFGQVRGCESLAIRCNRSSRRALRGDGCTSSGRDWLRRPAPSSRSTQPIGGREVRPLLASGCWNNVSSFARVGRLTCEGRCLEDFRSFVRTIRLPVTAPIGWTQKNADR